jgi:hypothetical protein
MTSSKVLIVIALLIVFVILATITTIWETAIVAFVVYFCLFKTADVPLYKVAAWFFGTVAIFLIGVHLLILEFIWIICGIATKKYWI